MKDHTLIASHLFNGKRSGVMASALARVSVKLKTAKQLLLDKAGVTVSPDADASNLYSIGIGDPQAAAAAWPPRNSPPPPFSNFVASCRPVVLKI